MGVIGSPVDAADAARPFSLTKSQFTSVKKNATTALTKSKQNAKAITALQNSGVAGPQGPQGLPGANGGFDPAKVTRVTGPVVPVTGVQDYAPYTLPCPSGRIALSGGWHTLAPAVEKALRVTTSEPTANLSGWHFRFAYQAPAQFTAAVIPYVVCAGK